MNIIEKFKAQGTLLNETYLFDATESNKIVKYCQEEKVEILGIDGFLITDNTVELLQEHSVDYCASWAPKGNRWELALDFLSKQENKNLLFEIVIDE